MWSKQSNDTICDLGPDKIRQPSDVRKDLAFKECIEGRFKMKARVRTGAMKVGVLVAVAKVVAAVVDKVIVITMIVKIASVQKKRESYHTNKHELCKGRPRTR